MRVLQQCNGAAMSPSILSVRLSRKLRQMRWCGNVPGNGWYQPCKLETVSLSVLLVVAVVVTALVLRRLIKLKRRLQTNSTSIARLYLLISASLLAVAHLAWLFIVALATVPLRIKCSARPSFFLYGLSYWWALDRNTSEDGRTESRLGRPEAMACSMHRANQIAL